VACTCAATVAAVSGVGEGGGRLLRRHSVRRGYNAHATDLETQARPGHPPRLQLDARYGTAFLHRIAHETGWSTRWPRGSCFGPRPSTWSSHPILPQE